MAKSSVLIVDDDHASRRLLQFLLEQEGYELRSASCGEDALVECKNTQPDLVLLDVMMPGISGFEVCRELRADALTAETPIILLTALDDSKSRIEGLDAGADDFVSKPFNQPELRARVKTILRLNRYRKLLNQQSQLSLLAELLPHGMVLLNSEGIVQFANPAMAAMLDLDSSEQLLHRSFRRFINPDHEANLRAHICEMLRSGDVVRDVETRLVTRRGRTFPASIDGINFAWDGTTMAQLLVRDTTEHRLYLEGLERQAYLEREAGLANLEVISRIEGLSRHLLATQEFERRALARELHDEIGQQVGALKLNLRAMARTNQEPITAGRLRDCLNIIDDTIAAIRNKALELRPSMLDDFGLEAALDWYCSRQADRSGARFDLRVEGLKTRPDPETETACFRIVQEALNNGLRHGHAQSFKIRIKRDGDLIEIRVKDDGSGFDTEAVFARTRTGSGFGLLSMRERAELLGGSLSVQSAPGSGTAIVAQIPIAGTSKSTSSFELRENSIPSPKLAHGGN